MQTDITYSKYNNVSGIYMIQSTIDNRKYIGSAVNLHNRFCVHKHNLEKHKHNNRHLQRFYDKYGSEYLKFIVVEECDRNILLKREQFFINKIKPSFNGSKTAGSNLGFKRSPLTEEHKIKISTSSKGHKKSIQTRRRMSISFTGRTCKEETKKKIGMANRKINIKDKKVINDKYKSGTRTVDLAEEFNVSLATIYNNLKY